LYDDDVLIFGKDQGEHEIKRFVGMTNQLSKFIPCSADLMKPLTYLLVGKEAFAKVNPLLPNTCLLKFIHNSFDPGATELKLPSFYSGRPGVSNDALCEAKISS